MEKLNYITSLPLPHQYLTLRTSVGWHPLTIEKAETALKNSVYCISVMQDDTLIGFGRIVGDGSIYFYVQDILVMPEYQRKGIGSEIMKHIMLQLDNLAPKKSGAFIGLMIAPGLKEFYRKFGFEEFPSETPSLRIWRNGH